MTDPISLLDPEDLLRFWFGDDVAGGSWKPRRADWFGGGPALDAEIERRFGDAVRAAQRGELDALGGTPRGRLALVILLDQLSRNVFRGRAEAFAADARALAAARAGVAAGALEALHPIERVFLLMPYMHSERLADHDEGLGHFEALARVKTDDAELRAQLDSTLAFAQEHRDLVARFGRYPHRNAALGRPDTPEEAAYLAAGAARYGQ